MDENSITLRATVEDGTLHLYTDGHLTDEFAESNEARVLVLFCLGLQAVARNHCEDLIELGYQTLMDEQDDLDNMTPEGNA